MNAHIINAPKRTTRSRNPRRTRAACGTRGRCRSAAARGPTPSTRAPSSSTPGHCQSDVATTDSSTTAPGCRRGACRALPRAISRRITRSGPRRCSPRSPACQASSPSLCANQPVSRRRVDGVEDDAAIQDACAVNLISTHLRAVRVDPGMVELHCRAGFPPEDDARVALVVSRCAPGPLRGRGAARHALARRHEQQVVDVEEAHAAARPQLRI